MRVYTVALLAALAVTACRRSEEKPQETTLTSASVDMVSTSVATDRIAAARCAREVMCSSLGGIDQPFVSHDSCVRDYAGRLRADVGEMRCPPLVERQGVEVCLREIGNESCNNPVDARFCAAPSSGSQLNPHETRSCRWLKTMVILTAIRSPA